MNLNTGMINATYIPFPVSVNEQTAISKALSDVDTLITSLEKLIAKKQAIKTATMQQLLTGKKRLPGFGEGKGYKQTELGEIPVDWEVVKLGDVFLVTAGGDLRKEQFSANVTSENLYPIFSNAITKKGLYGFCSTFDYNGDYITVTARGGVGHAVDRAEEFCAIGRLLVLEPKGSLSCKFIKEYINQYISFANESTGVPQLTAPQISKYLILFPLPEEQAAIANILSDIDKDIEQQQLRLNKTQQIKQGMMQELLTGKTRLI